MRLRILLLLGCFLILGFSVLGFNRSPSQAFLTTTYCVLLELGLRWLFKRPLNLPISAVITSFSLSILLDYPHQYELLIFPALFAIVPKFIFTVNGRHWFNPALTGVTLSFLLMGDRIGLAPAYQWNEFSFMGVFMILAGLFLLLPKINRHYLVGSFLLSYFAATTIRALWFEGHLPFETVFVGAISTPAFFLFTFFMITDPATSPDSRREQIRLGFFLALTDLIFHMFWSYYTLFYAAAVIGSLRFLAAHFAQLRRGSPPWPILLRRLSILGLFAFVIYSGIAITHAFNPGTIDPGFKLKPIPSSVTGITGAIHQNIEELDPRIQHLGMLLGATMENVAVGDFDGDGLKDLFFNNTHRRGPERNELYRNLGNFRFEKVTVPTLQNLGPSGKRGVSTNATFVDYDNDGDQDLFIGFVSGRPLLLRNLLRERGRAEFTDVTVASGLDIYTNSNASLFFDFNQDGRLDLLILNLLAENLSGYSKLTPLNFFSLPKPEYPNDDRGTNFLHDHFLDAQNGGHKRLFLQNGSGQFQETDVGFNRTLWSMAAGSGDFNHDGWPDIYIANEVGPDELFLNREGKFFEPVIGSGFNSVGRDTYKGMNVSIEDLDRNGFFDIHVSNIHHPLIMEGSMVWAFDAATVDAPKKLVNRASSWGLLNENSHGWGAGVSDFNHDGWLDVVQTNGMFAKVDGTSENCEDFWYLNEKLMRAPRHIHSNAINWGQVNGKCMMPNEPARFYIGRPKGRSVRFYDLADQIGLDVRRNTRGAAVVDLNNDGFQDLVMTGTNTLPLIFENEPSSAREREWIGLSLEGDGINCNRDAVGTVVRLLRPVDDPRFAPQMRNVQNTNGYQAQNDRRIIFGLGEKSGPVDVEINWCGRQIEIRRDLATGRYHHIEMKRKNDPLITSRTKTRQPVFRR